MSRVGGVVLGGGWMDRRQSWRSASWASLDLEATGLDPAVDEIVSFGVVPIEEGRVRLDRSDYRLVRPTVASATRAVALHRILPAELEGADRLDAVADWLRSALWRRIVVGWTSWVEAGFLSRALGGRASSWERNIADVRGLIALVDALEGRGRSVRGEGLTEAAARFGVPPEREHHALWDAFVTAELFVVVASRLERLGVTGIGRLLLAGRPRRARPRRGR